MSKITLLLGPRRCGKTYQAIKKAEASGRPFGVLAPTKALAGAISKVYAVEAYSTRVRHWTNTWRLAVIDDVHEIGKRAFLSIVGYLQDADADLIMTANPPTRKSQEWFLGLKDSGLLVVEELSALTETS